MFGLLLAYDNINTIAVIDAAAKWSFIKLTSGLVSGYCIGVDSY